MLLSPLITIGDSGRNVRKGDCLKEIELGWWVIMKLFFIFEEQEIK